MLLRLKYFPEDSNFKYEEFNLESFIENDKISIKKLFEFDFKFNFYLESKTVNDLRLLFIKDTSSKNIENDIRINEFILTYHYGMILANLIIEYIKKLEIDINKEIRQYPLDYRNLPYFIDENNYEKYLRLLVISLSIPYFSGKTIKDYIDCFNKYQGDAYLNNLDMFINKNSSESAKLFKLFRLLNSKCKRIKKSCVAIAEEGKNTYFSLSGTSVDYIDKTFNNWLIIPVYEELYDMINKDFFSNNATICHLNDKVLISKKFINKYINEEEISITRLIDFIIRNYSCCERKILSYIDDAKLISNLNMFVKYSPCQKCQCYVKDIKSLVYFDSNKYEDFIENKLSLSDAIIIGI